MPTNFLEENGLPSHSALQVAEEKTRNIWFIQRETMLVTAPLPLMLIPTSKIKKTLLRGEVSAGERTRPAQRAWMNAA